MDPLSTDNHPLEDEVTLPWYHQGLRFRCTGCGKCCTGSPGYVFLSTTDLERLIHHFSMPQETFLARYTRLVDERLALIDRPGSADCIFLQNNQCSVYDARPTQCRTFPWWVDQIRDASAWAEAKERCEGIDHPDAPVVSALEIEKECLTYLDNLLEQNFF